jgi:argininosuccinate lyase
MSKLWGGRFNQTTDDVINTFNASIDFDARLWRHDIRGSIAHVKMLGKCSIITPDEAEAIGAGLTAVEEDLSIGSSVFSPEFEDVHMNVEHLLREKIGPIAGKLHTGRSRNDQIATDIRLWLKDEVENILGLIKGVQAQLLLQSNEHVDTVLPGMTHLQHAQPVRLAHHLLAYFWMLQRDRERLVDAATRMDVLSLGAGALAGTSYPIDRQFVAEQLGFARVSENSMDSVSDRDFVVETLSAIAILFVHLSRFSEEMILWNSQEFGFVTMGDNVTTGSSIMPQKKNPDVVELIRGKSGRTFGNLMAVLTMLKGLPLSYNKDMQEDKEPLFDSVDTAKISLQSLRILLQNMTFSVDRMLSATRGDFSTATDLADCLVRAGLPFREAHEVVGNVVKNCELSGRILEDLSVADLIEFSPLFVGAGRDITSVVGSVNSRTSAGGVGREALLYQLDQAKDALAKERSRI